MNVFTVILKNLIGYDFLIFLLAAVNAWFFVVTKRRALSLYKKLHLVIFLPIQPLKGGTIKTPGKTFEVESFVKMREEAESIYAVFTNLTVIFPLMGILGTVISLLPMVSQMANVETNFCTALTSTFWGLVFAIAFKICDAFLTSRMEDNDKNVTLLLSRIGTDTEPAEEPDGKNAEKQSVKTAKWPKALQKEEAAKEEEEEDDE